MTRIKALIRFLFGFSRTETNAFLVLLPLMLIVIISEPVYQTYFMSNNPDNFSDQKMLDSLVLLFPAEKENQVVLEKKLPKRIPARKRFTPQPRFTPKPQLEKFDLNLADTSQLKSIYGIGSKLAQRIILYRTNLGGFVSSDQLYEVWGLDSTVVVRLTSKSAIAPDFTPNQLAINHCNEQDFARHPYIRTKLARAIVNYRFQHGNFDSIDDLKKIGTMEEKIFLRIKPYITLE